MELTGVQVGEVADVQLLPRGQGVDVILEIQKDVEIPRGSVAVVTGISALDNVSVSIRPGQFGDAVLEDGDRIEGYTDAGLLAQVDSTLTSARGPSAMRRT